MVRRGGANHPPRRQSSHVPLWATLTVAAFPIVALSSGWLGADPFRSFFYGALASLSVLLLEAAVRRRWWISDPAIASVLSNPELGFRMLVFVGTIVLVFQTFLFVGFFTNGSFDKNVLRFVFQRQCDGAGNGYFARMCLVHLTNPGDARIDMATLAVREAAEKRFFGGGLVTCAVKPAATSFEARSCTYSAFVRCDRWVVSRIAGTPMRVETVQKPVVAVLSVQSDGTYRMLHWADDPSASAWETYGEAGRNAARLSFDTDAEAQLASETYRRMLERLAP